MNTKLLLSFLVFFALSGYAQYQNFADSYGILTTIAGSGVNDNDNDWKAEFEDGLATDADLSRPHFAMADEAGNIYIADKESHAIRKVSTDGIITTIAGNNIQGDNDALVATDCQLSNPNGLWVKNDGTVYILDLGNNKIRRANTDGTIETIVDDESGFSLGRGIWVSKNEDSIFYASSSRIKLWTASNGIEDYASGFSGVANIVQDMNGHLVVTARSENKVYRINKSDRTKEVIAGNGSSSGGGDGALATETGVAGVRGVWFIDDNTYFLATHEGSQIWYVDYKGIIHLFLDGEDDDDSHFGDGENYNTPGSKISEARSVSVDYDGNVIICENDLGYIRKIENKYTYYYTNLFNDNFIDYKLNAYPNPANNYVQISYYTNKTESAEVNIYNSIGALVKGKQLESRSQGINNTDFDISDLPGGVYYYTLIFNNESISKKLVVR